MRKLDDLFLKEFAIVHTMYGIKAENLHEDEDDYDITYVGQVTASDLDPVVIECIKRESTEYDPDDSIEVWEGKVSTVAGLEDVTVYLPDSWE